MQQTAIYMIRIAQVLSTADASWFEGLTIYPLAGVETLLLTPPVDQAGLHGILATIRDLAIPLVAVYQVGAPSPEEINPRSVGASGGTGWSEAGMQEGHLDDR